MRHIHLERESGCKYNAKEHVVLSKQKAIQSNSVSCQCSFVSFYVGRPGDSEVQREGGARELACKGGERRLPGMKPISQVPVSVELSIRQRLTIVVRSQGRCDTRRYRTGRLDFVDDFVPHKLDNSI
jgi:hypothetical protein